MTDIPSRDQMKPGTKVGIETKEDQGSGKISIGIVKNILTSSNIHPHGIKVELEDGQVGRVKKIISESTSNDSKEIRSKILEKLKKLDVKTTESTNDGSKSSETTRKLDTIIPKDEDTWNEFKSTFQYDLAEENLRRDGKTEAADARKNNHKSIRDDIQKEISLTVAAFANQEGGRLFVGVNDDSSVLGLGRDLKEYGNSIDKFTLAITDSLKKYLQNSAFIAKLKFEFVDSGDKQYLVIQVPRSTEPIFVNVSNGQEAYVRIQKSSDKFSYEDFLKHCRDRFPN
jgi:uncharacterized repeat protein (TIGR03833 family)